MARRGPKKKNPEACRTERVAVVMVPGTMAALRERALRERRNPSAMAAVLIEDGLGLSPSPEKTRETA